MRNQRLSLIIVALLTGSLPPSASGEESRWALCPTPPALTAQPAAAHPHLDGRALFARADRVESDQEQHLRLIGNVELEQRGVRVFSQQAEYLRPQDTLLFSEGLSLHSEELYLEARAAEYQPGIYRGHFHEVRFFLANSHSYGRARSLQLHDSDHLELTRLSYSTCPPEQEDWRLSARHLRLNQATNTGEAYHTTLRFMGLPFFYTPYLNFPLTGRKSGLLPPSYGTSSRNGIDLSLPIYWNIAPHRDATLTPRYLSKRGTMLAAEFRFLEEQHAGEIRTAWLGDDRQYGEDRSELVLRHTARLSPGWRSELRYHGVSDDDYYRDDLGQPQQSRQQSNLERRFDLRYHDPHWQFLARAQGYQSLDGSNPYQRLPQMQLRGSSPRRHMQAQWRLHSEAVRFHHQTRVPTGERLDLKPEVLLPLSGAAWFLTPSLAWRHTEYRLSDHPAGARQQRSLPIASLDSGLFFERPWHTQGRHYTQTLEPRLYYLYVPYRDQDDLPLFDSARTDPSLAGLFRDNRFTGADRQGDARQLTLALTSRLLEDDSGKELVRAGIAQARYLDPPRVTLNPGDPLESRHYSDIIGELSLRPLDPWQLQLTEQWDPRQGRTQQRHFGLQYRPQAGQLLQTNYRHYLPEAQRQADLTALWPLTPRWRILAHHHRDLERGRTLRTLAGLEYQSCCWTTRLFAQSRRDHADKPLNSAVMLTLELKGLATLGQSLEERIGHDILGYD